MSILAIDTCEGSCSAALVNAGGVLASRTEAIGRGHAERLLPMLDELFDEAGLGYDALTRVAVTTGPGTFTGLRIGLSVARGLGLSLGVPVLGVTSLMALAAAVREQGSCVHAVIMGRGGQGFHQAFRIATDGLAPSPLSDARSMAGDAIHAAVSLRPGHVVGSGRTLAGCGEPGLPVDPVVLGRLAAGLSPAAYPPEPAYLRAADAVKAKALLPTE
ncbi:tRNA (adenosine(37)-N6)-threonylcarbamoyltransferase complex dimerization subunit type 1 TsaB [Kordiimonas aestuarii]|uniref:tRNA (adenosine(37)-N6)-threonylcarbamoyltransferase complex dimerization subunit type 1 TsaB n=1 Tax=Kordiimonas aestuarii TaxID=1005925 RepID=UPI0021CE45E6|nr:tRNA (adenosine(37)-N6)-threonylcarbamoyltransferase complex dimerization subunit type 1 TsaB [Kordiimonas aestuarii]